MHVSVTATLAMAAVALCAAVAAWLGAFVAGTVLAPGGALSYAQRLNALGFDVHADPANPRTLHAELRGHAVRLVFDSQEGGGIRTYIGS